jgi:hypothetical protein
LRGACHRARVRDPSAPSGLRDRCKICPTGKSAKTCTAPLSKIFCFALYPNHSYIHHRLVPLEGRIAIVTDAGWDAVDADSAIDERHEGGRRSRVVLTPRRWCQVGGSNSADDGGKRARSPGRARRKPLKPLRAGMPGCSGGPVVTNARVYYTTRAAAGASAPGIPHALKGRKFLAQLGRLAPRECERISSRHCEEHLRRSNPASLFAVPKLDCFAEPVIGRRFAPTRWLCTRHGH